MSILRNLLRILFVVSRYQLLTYNDIKSIPAFISIIFRIIEFIFYPIGLIKKPRTSACTRLASCLESLGPIYVKFGQTLSTRPDLIGHKIAESLQYLQNNLQAFDYKIAQKTMQSEFGMDWHALFTFFDTQPVAAASISQVYKAYLTSGEAVAVKILRPHIHEKYNNDIKLLYFFAKLLPKLFKKFKRLKIIEVVDLFRATMTVELDLRLEAAAMSEMSDNFKNDASVYVPRIYWNMTTHVVMTTEWIDGISIYDKKGLIAAGFELSQISRKIAVLFFNQAYRDGFFHADLHPGNILVKKDYSIVLLDFGIMGRLSDRDRLAIAEILFAFLNRDYKNVANIHLQAGYIPKNSNIELFAQTCRAISEPIMGRPAKEIFIGALLAQLFKVTEDFGMETQPQLLLLQKTMVMVEGIGSSLDSELNMWLLAQDWIKNWAAKNISPEAKLLRAINDRIIKFLEYRQ